MTVVLSPSLLPLNAPLRATASTARALMPLDAALARPASALLAETTPAETTLPALHWYQAADQGRAGLEQYIAAGFADVYDARISHFMPHLLGIRAGGAWQAVLGIRAAAVAPLFVEQYLDADICTVLADNGVVAQRFEVAEIGNLYASGRQQTLLLFVAMAVALYQQGIRQLVCCATPTVMSMLSRHGLKLQVLAEGDPARLGEGARDWGSYYQRHPQVCLLSLAEAWQIIKADQRLTALLAPYAAMLQQAAATLLPAAPAQSAAMTQEAV